MMSVCSVLIIQTCSTTWRPSSNASATVGPHHNLHCILGQNGLLHGLLSAQRSCHFPLSRLTEKVGKFKWTLEGESTFRDLKTVSTSAPILVCLTRPSNSHAMVGVLSQVLADGKDHVISYNSRALEKVDRKNSSNNNTTYRDILAMKPIFKNYFLNWISI